MVVEAGTLVHQLLRAMAFRRKTKSCLPLENFLRAARDKEMGLMFEIRITGFKTRAQASAFYDWYEGQGEQDAGVWFECQKSEGKIDVDFMPVDVQKGSSWNKNVLSFEVEPS